LPADNGNGGGGKLTVGDGVNAANLALLGQYAAAGFSTSVDAGGGTVVTYDPTLDPSHQTLSLSVG
jgi:hypothetical protein